MTTATRMMVLDPTVGSLAETMVMAPRLETLAGARIGLLSNGKNGVGRFLDELERALAEQYPGVRFERAAKGNASRPAPPATLDTLAEGCAAVVTAVGD